MVLPRDILSFGVPVRQQAEPAVPQPRIPTDKENMLKTIATYRVSRGGSWFLYMMTFARTDISERGDLFLGFRLIRRP